MVKRRDPDTIEGALIAAMAHLGTDKIGEIVGKSEALVHKWSDPDSDQTPQHKQSVRIDIECARAGIGTPLLNAHRRMVESAVTTAMREEPKRDPAHVILELQRVAGALAGCVADGWSDLHEIRQLTSELRRIADEIDPKFAMELGGC